MGCFATMPIEKGLRLIEYVGERITKAEAAKRCEADNQYIFTIDDHYDLDGNVGWNPAKFINHSCDPNCEAELDNGRIFINALRDIQPGEEITFNYGYDFEGYEDHPCRCGAPNCVGYMVAEEFFPQVLKNKPSNTLQEV